MRNWAQFWDKAQQRSKRAEYAARCRWDRYHASAPMRDSRVIEITIRDSHRPRTIIRAQQDQLDDGRWSRLRIDGSQGRPVSRHGLAQRIASALL